jgi:hypothetical protein
MDSSQMPTIQYSDSAVSESDSILFPRTAGGIFSSRFVYGVQISGLVANSVTAAPEEYQRR